MIVVSPSLVLEKSGALGANNPLIGYEQLATLSNISATSADANNPVTNLCNPATNLLWVSASTTTQYITVMHDRIDPIDYVGVAEHNWGSTNCIISIEGFAERDEDDLPIWFELVARVLQDDAPAIFRFTPQSLIGVRVKLVPNGVAPQAANLRVGKLLVLPRPIYVGHSPITLTRQRSASNGRSERGKFLGRIITQESVSTSAALQHLPKGWYRETFQPFVEAVGNDAFFWAWRPQEFPNEVGYCWLTSDPVPVNSNPEGFLEVELSLGGVVT